MLSVVAVAVPAGVEEDEGAVVVPSVRQRLFSKQDSDESGSESGSESESGEDDDATEEDVEEGSESEPEEEGEGESCSDEDATETEEEEPLRIDPAEKLRLEERLMRAQVLREYSKAMKRLGSRSSQALAAEEARSKKADPDYVVRPRRACRVETDAAIAILAAAETLDLPESDGEAEEEGKPKVKKAKEPPSQTDAHLAGKKRLHDEIVPLDPDDVAVVDSYKKRIYMDKPEAAPPAPAPVPESRITSE
jgi:hypothetical protein